MEPSAPDLLSGLNSAQRAAVETLDGPLLILAGAGSGKTRVITHRLAHLINSGVPAESILAVTFTNKAADEMLRRVRELIGDSELRLWISTFHSAAVRILRRDITHLGRTRDFTIYDEDDSTALVKHVIRDFGLDPKDEEPRKHAELISRAKDELLTPDQWLDRSKRPREFSEKFHKIYTEYQRRMVSSNALDFGDLLVETVRLLEIPEVAARYVEKFSHVMVDEYQDTNRAQYRMIRILAGRENLAVVGDDDQSIYEWRGADRRNILDFEKDYPKAKVIELYRNYRSTQPILDAASNLISKNPRVREKKLFTEISGGEAPIVTCAGNEYDEMEKIVKHIRANVRAGARLNEHAIFYRVHAQSRVVEEILSASGLPYQILNGLSFYQRAEIKDVIAYLRVIANQRDDISLRRIINNPARGIGEVTVARVHAVSEGEPLFPSLDKAESIEELKPNVKRKIADFSAMIRALVAFSLDAPASETLRELLKQSGYVAQYDPADPEDQARIENVREFVSAAEEFQGSSLDPSLGAFLERISLAADVDQFDPEAESVLLTTLHSAKGLEFGHVYITGCEESLFPHARAFDDRKPAAMEEERRLAYVGMTRAMKSLMLTRAVERRIYGRIVANPASRFLYETGLVERTSMQSIQSSRGAFTSSAPVHTTFIHAPRAKPPARAASGSKSGASGGESLSEGDTVTHRKFGRGTVVYVADSGDENEVVRIKFSSGTTKDLLRKYANLSRV